MSKEKDKKITSFHILCEAGNKTDGIKNDVSKSNVIHRNASIVSK